MSANAELSRKDESTVLLPLVLHSLRARPQGQRHVESLLAFLAAQRSKHTRRAYGYSISLFFRWCRVFVGKQLSPSEVSRAQAAAYARWLWETTEWLDDVAIEEDSSKSDECSVYKSVKQRPGIGDNTLVQAMGATRAQSAITWLLRHCWLKRRNGGGYVIRSPRRAPPGPRRASTVSLRLSALSSYWDWLREQSAENVDGADKPLLAYNVWHVHLKKASRSAPSLKRASRSAKTPGVDLLVDMLATTYRDLTTKQAQEAALSALDGAATKRAHEDPCPINEAPGARLRALTDLRDRALLLLLSTTALRVDELSKLRRSGLVGGRMTVEGKGGRIRAIRVPVQTVKALEEMWNAIEWSAKSSRRRASSFSRLTAGDAPLVPPIRLKASLAMPKGLSPSAVALVLRKRALAAGIDPDTADWPRIHPHGLRHLAARRALQLGVHLPIVQAALGHASLGTTGQYVEELDAENVCLVPEH